MDNPPPNRFERSNSASDFIKPKTGEYAVVMAWNKLPKPACRHTKFNTQIMRDVFKYLSLMRKGLYGKNDRDHQWNKEWLEKNRVPDEFKNKVWSFQEIIKTIEGHLANMYEDSYLPESKKNLPTNLASALFNRHNGGSFFVQAYYNPPKQTKDKIPKDPYPKVTERLAKLAVSMPASNVVEEWKRYIAGLQGLEKSLKTINWKNYGARQMFPGGEKGELYGLVMAYVKWLKGRDYPELLAAPNIEKLEWSMLRPDFWAWRKFMEAVNLYWGKVFSEVRVEEE